ncbi:MAG: holo-ACP synthase [Rickettsiales bacterium]
MIYGIGIDLISSDRIAKTYNKYKDKFARKILHIEEYKEFELLKLNYCNFNNNSTNKNSFTNNNNNSTNTNSFNNNYTNSNNFNNNSINSNNFTNNNSINSNFINNRSYNSNNNSFANSDYTNNSSSFANNNFTNANINTNNSNNLNCFTNNAKINIANYLNNSNNDNSLNILENSNNYNLPIKLINFLAKKFAIKEAASKALGTGISNSCSFYDIYSSHDDNGKPILYFSDKIIKKFFQNKQVFNHLSISDHNNLIIALVTIEIY